MLKLSARYIRAWVLSIRAANFNTTEPQLISWTIICIWFWNMEVARKCFVVNCLVFKAWWSPNADVRRLKKLNAVLRKFTDWRLIVLMKPILRFCGSSFAARTYFVVRCSDVVCNKRRQGCVDYFGIVEFVLGVVRCGCCLFYSSFWWSYNCTVTTYFRFVRLVKIPAVHIVGSRTLKSHCIITGSVFTVNAQIDMVLLFRPWNLLSCGRCELMNLRVWPVSESILIFS